MMINGLGEIRRMEQDQSDMNKLMMQRQHSQEKGVSLFNKFNEPGEVLGTEHDEDLIIKHEITRHNLKNLKLNILSGYKDIRMIR